MRAAPSVTQVAFSSQRKLEQAWSNLQLLPSPMYGAVHSQRASPLTIVQRAFASQPACEHLSKHCVGSVLLAMKPALHVHCRPPGMFEQTAWAEQPPLVCAFCAHSSMSTQPSGSRR